MDGTNNNPCNALFYHFPILGNEPGVFDMLIVNDDLEEAYEKLQSVLIEVSLKRG